MTEVEFIEKKISKYQRKLKRVKEKSIFYREASKSNREAGRERISDVQKVQVNYYVRQEEKFEEVISDFKEVIKIL